MTGLVVAIFLVPFLAAIAAAIVGEWSPRAALAVTAAALVATATLAVSALVGVARHGPITIEMAGWRPPVGIEWLIDPFSALILAMIGVVAAVVFLGSLATIRDGVGFFCGSALLMITGLVGMVATHDLFNLFVFLEVSSLSAYALVAAGGRGAPSAAMRYLILGSLGASLYLLGIGFLYAATGSLNMSDVARQLADADPALTFVGGVLILAGLAVKIGLFPLHGWMPGAYSRAPVAAAALMAPLVTKASAYAAARVFFWVLDGAGAAPADILLEALAWLGVLAIGGGVVMALIQTDLWRLLAYSSISQMGIVALGLGIANPTAMTGAMLHIVNDGLMKGALFLAAAVALSRFGVRRIDALGALRGRAPWTATAIFVAGLSLVGLPPLCGFFGKWYVLLGALDAGRWGFATVIVLASLGSAAYVFRILERLFFAPASEAGEAREGPAAPVAAAGALALGVLGFGLASELVVRWVVEPGLP